MVDFKILVDRLLNHDRHDGPAGFSNGNGTNTKDMIPNFLSVDLFHDCLQVALDNISVKYQRILLQYGSF